MIEFKSGTDCIDWVQLCALYSEVGLVGMFGEQRNCEGIRSAFLGSSKVVTAWDGEHLVGASRLISDGICYGTVFDIGVSPKHRRQGIATGMMKVLLEDTENMSVHLTSAFGIEGLYRKLGFKQHKNAFAKYPYESEYLAD